MLLQGYLQFLSASFGDRVGKALSSMGFRNLEEFGDVVNSLLGRKEDISAEKIEEFSSLTVTARQLPLTLKTPSIDDIREIFRKGFGR
jgi:hypothetical protein